MAASMLNHISTTLRNVLRPALKNSQLLQEQCLYLTQTRLCNSDVPDLPGEKKKPNRHKPLLTWTTTRDYNNRLLVKEFGPLRQRLNTVRKNTVLPKEVREIADAEIHALTPRSSITRTYPRCILSGKSRGRVRRWRLGRIQWRLFADYNKLSGVTRAKW